MTKETIELKIAALPVYVPVRLIEEKLGMPKTTLQKVLKGGRKLPKKWIKPLEAFLAAKPAERQIPPSSPAKPKIKAKEPSTERFGENIAIVNSTPGRVEAEPPKNIEQITQRIADLENELKTPPKNPMIGLRAWTRLRENELNGLKSMVK